MNSQVKVSALGHPDKVADLISDGGNFSHKSKGRE